MNRRKDVDFLQNRKENDGLHRINFEQKKEKKRRNVWYFSRKLKKNVIFMRFSSVFFYF